MTFTNEEVMRMTEIALQKFSSFSSEKTDEGLIIDIPKNIADSWPKAIRLNGDILFGVPTKIL